MINCRDGGTVPSTEKNETMFLEAMMKMREHEVSRRLGGGGIGGGGNPRMHA